MLKILSLATINIALKTLLFFFSFFFLLNTLPRGLSQNRKTFLKHQFQQWYITSLSGSNWKSTVRIQGFITFATYNQTALCFVAVTQSKETALYPMCL
jgi:hypothetical protein